MANEAAATTPSSGAAEGSEQKKKIAGKYESVEQAVESLDRGFTTSFHAMKEELSSVRQLLERAFTGDAGTADIGTRGRTDQGYNRGTASDDEDFDATAFLSSPGKILSAREKKQEERIGKLVANMVANASIVSRFQAKNPDLDEHEELVTMFVNKLDPRTYKGGLKSCLNEAAKMTRAYLKKLKGEGSSEEEDAGRSASEEEFVEGPTGRRAEGSAGASQGNEKVQTDDEALAESIAEHKAFKASRFAPKTVK